MKLPQGTFKGFASVIALAVMPFAVSLIVVTLGEDSLAPLGGFFLIVPLLVLYIFTGLIAMALRVKDTHKAAFRVLLVASVLATICIAILSLSG